MKEFPTELQAAFNTVGAALEGRRDELNRLDELNGDHGDHMVEIFHLAAQAAGEGESSSLSDAMQRAQRAVERAR